ncbi:MAG: DedA family protein, partial [Deltaproteobacteria bacterium]|nr:DedA family protein [Deltaproteobacteria bacterium]
MEPQIIYLIEHGSYLIILLYLLGAGLGLPLPEDIALITIGVLLERGIMTIGPATVLVVVGVLGGDISIFLMARRWGPLAYQHRVISRILPPERREYLENLFERYGGRVIFVARQLAGIRAPVFAMAGIHRMRVRSFIIWDSLALLVSGPLWVGLGFFFSNRLDEALRDVHLAKKYGLMGLSALLVLGLGYWLFKRKVLPPSVKEKQLKQSTDIS